MSLEEILNDITILQNNCDDPATFLIVALIWGVIIITLDIFCIIWTLRDDLYPSPKVTIMTIGGLLILGMVVYIIVCLTNETLYLDHTFVKLYVKLNDVPLEDVAKYFTLSDTCSSNDQIFTTITPSNEYSGEIRQILHSMEII